MYQLLLLLSLCFWLFSFLSLLFYYYCTYTHWTYLYNIHVYVYVCIYIYIGRTCLVAPMLSLIRMRSVCIQLNTNVIRGLVKCAQLLWHVHNFCETCTTAGKRAQHLWHLHNISETCTTSLKRAHIEYLKTLGGGGETRYTHIYIYIWAGTPTPPPSPSQMVPPPLWQGRGGFLSSQADIRKIYSSVQGVCQQCPRYCVSSTGEYT